MIYPANSINAIAALESQRTEHYLYVPKEEVCICPECGEKIYEGDSCLECDNGTYCRKCIMLMTSDDVVELLGYSFKHAECNNL